MIILDRMDDVFRKWISMDRKKIHVTLYLIKSKRIYCLKVSIFIVNILHSKISIQIFTDCTYFSSILFIHCHRKFYCLFVIRF